MNNSAQIRVEGDSTVMEFQWLDFDGDDCFGDFHVKVTGAGENVRFDFGPCAIHGLRQLTKFFKDPTHTTVGLGFQNPDIRYCDVDRVGLGYCLRVRFESSELDERFRISSPSVTIDDTFLDQR